MINFSFLTTNHQVHLACVQADAVHWRDQVWRWDEEVHVYNDRIRDLRAKVANL